MTLWIFGDSYAQPAQKKFYDLVERPLTWKEELGYKLQTKVDGEGRPGVSQEYLFNSFKTRSNSFKKDDYCIFIHTESQRRWFFNDRPEVSNLWMNSFGDLVKKDEKKAIESYKKYLYNPMLGNSITEMLSTFINWTCMSKQMNVIQIAGFEVEEHFIQNPSVDVVGNMLNIAKGEFKGDIMPACFDANSGMDMRLNHMSWPNHDKFAEALYKSLVNKETLDLSEGWYKDIYTSISNYTELNSEYAKYQWQY